MIYISQQAPRASMKDIANQNTHSTAPTGNSNINFFLAALSIDYPAIAVLADDWFYTTVSNA